MREWRARNPGHDSRSRYLVGRLRLKPREWYIRLEQFNFKCAYCGKAEPTEIDHFQPSSLGGSNDWDNLVPACRSCNASKNGKLPQEWCSPESHQAIKAILEKPLLITGNVRGQTGPGTTRGKQAKAVQPQRLSEEAPQ
jgi:hypothetical protein